MNTFKKIFIHSPKRYIFSFFLTISFIVIYNSLRDDWTTFYNYVDALFISGFTLISIGALSILNNFGAFDIWKYTFKNTIRNRNQERITLKDYSDLKREERKKNMFLFVPFMSVGFLVLILSIVLGAF